MPLLVSEHPDMPELGRGKDTLNWIWDYILIYIGLDILILASDREAIDHPWYAVRGRKRQMSLKAIGRKEKLFPDCIDQVQPISNKAIMFILQSIGEK